MHMYTTSIVAKMHKIQFIRRKGKTFSLVKKASGISENKQFLTVVDVMFLCFVSLCSNKTVKHQSISQAVLTPCLFSTEGDFNKNSV